MPNATETPTAQDEVQLYRALCLAESNLRVGYAARPALQKATEVLGGSVTELALLLLEKALECGRAREERQAMNAYDAFIEGAPLRAGSASGHRASRGRRAVER